jgi:hypothetical protein
MSQAIEKLQKGLAEAEKMRNIYEQGVWTVEFNELTDKILGAYFINI